MIHSLLIGFTWLDMFLYINILLVISVIFFTRKNPTTTWAWIMLMLFIPFVGFILYLMFGQDLRKRKTFIKKEEEDRFLAVAHRQQTSLWQHFNEYDNPLINAYESLISLHLNAHDSLYTEDNTVDIIIDGKELFNVMFENIKKAKRYIHIEYYIIKNDELGKALKDLLVAKAKEGIEVFLLYDDMGCFGIPSKFFHELAEAGVKTACFFPSFIPFIKFRANYRNHRKICVIDGLVGYLGGFNIGEEYIGLNKKLGYWRDTHLKITGSAVRLINLQFLLDRRFATSEDLLLDKYIPIETNSAPGNVGMQIVSSGPDSKQQGIRDGFIKMIYTAKRYIYIQTPYFVPDEVVLTALKLAALSGIDVRVMIPNKPDHIFVYWATYAHIGEILDCGAKCYTYEKGFLHAKTIVIDDTICSVGTANCDIRSFKLNFEINAFIYNETITKKLSRIFLEDILDCKEVTPEIYKNRNLIIKIKESIARLLSPIL